MPGKLPTAAFVLGSGRSGTTLLRVMLAGHPKLFSPPEMLLAPFDSMREHLEHLNRRYWEKGGLRRALMNLRGLDVDAAKTEAAALESKSIEEVYAHLQKLCAGRLIVDKCPHLAQDIALLEKQEARFVAPRYLWIVRHPGSVIRSFQNMPMAEVMLQGFGDAPSAWYGANTNLKHFFAGIPKERWLMIRYEDLVAEPERIMRAACDTLGVPFDAKVLDPYEGDRMREGPKGARAIGDPNMAGRGKIDPGLATKWLHGFDPRALGEPARELALELGYDLSAMDLPPIAAVTQAFADLMDTAKRLEASIDVPMDTDALEGRRFILRLLQAALDLFVERADTDRPAFMHAEGPHRKMFADCPDTDYLRAPIKLGGGRVYRVRGRIPADATYVGVLLYGRGGRVGARLSDAALTPDKNGKFELLIAAEPQRGLHLVGEPDDSAVMVRQYFTDRRTQTPLDLEISYLGTQAPAPLSPQGLAKGLDRAKRMLTSVFERTLGAYKMASTGALNRFIELTGEQLFPTPDNIYQMAWYRFGEDQVMLVRGTLPRARYFSLTLYNVWMESLDYTRHTVSRNHATLTADKDGRFEVCLAHRDVGHPNWLDTTGHHAGYVLARSLLLDGPAPALETQVMYEKEFRSSR